MKLQWFSLICLVLVSTSAAYGMPPQRIELTFEIRYGAMKLGEGKDRLEHDGKRYQVNSDTIPKGLAALFINDIRRESKGSITDGWLRPASFVERGRKQGIRAAEFDWTNNTLRLIEGDTNHTVALPDRSIDQACLPYAFAFAGGVPDEFTVHVTDGRRLKEYRYRILGRERIETVLGEFDTIHIEKVRDPDSKRSFEFWVAVEHHYLPVQIRAADKKGREFDSVVTAILYP